MTMPHLMNCSHSDNGWCLACVKAMHEEHERHVAEIAETAANLCMGSVRDMREAHERQVAKIASKATEAERLCGEIRVRNDLIALLVAEMACGRPLRKTKSGSR